MALILFLVIITAALLYIDQRGNVIRIKQDLITRIKTERDINDMSLLKEFIHIAIEDKLSK